MIKAFAEAVHGELRGNVSRHVGRADLSGYRRNVDDVPATSRNHRRERFMRAIDRAQIVRPHDLLNRLDRHFNEWVTHADAGVVDKNIDLPKLGDNFADHGVDLFAVADIALDGYRWRARPAHIFERHGEPLPRTGAAHDRGASRCKINGEASADAG